MVGEAADGAEALRRVAESAPEVVLMDLRMPVLDGVAATRRIRVEHPQVQVIVLTTFDDDADVFAALRAGAVGYLLKDASSARLVEAVLAAARGESVLQPSVAAKVVARFAGLPTDEPQRPQPLVVPLSERELEVVRLLAEGTATGRSRPRCSWPRVRSRTTSPTSWASSAPGIALRRRCGRGHSACCDKPCREHDPGS